MNKIEITLRSFLSDIVRYNTVSLQEDREKNTVTIETKKINAIIRSIEQYFNNEIEIHLYKDNILSLSNEARDKFIWDDRQRTFTLDKSYFNTETEIPDNMLEDYKTLINQ